MRKQSKPTNFKIKKRRLGLCFFILLLTASLIFFIGRGFTNNFETMFLSSSEDKEEKLEEGEEGKEGKEGEEEKLKKSKEVSGEISDEIKDDRAQSTKEKEDDESHKDDTKQGIERTQKYKDYKNNEPLDWGREDIVENLSHFVSPVEDALISDRDNHLPGAPREYRNGVHQGLDYFHHYVGVKIEMGTPVHAVDSGKVKRATHDFEELEADERQRLLDEAHEEGKTSEETLDKLRGKQVEILHEDGVMTRYAHLKEIDGEIKEGEQVKKGDKIGSIGNSGTSAAAEGDDTDPHLHFEIWLGEDRFLGERKEIPRTREIFQEILLD